jgi:DMSO reductase anchor subunit
VGNSVLHRNDLRCLKTIPRWNTWLVPAAYIVNGHLSGGLILLALANAKEKTGGGHFLLVVIAVAMAGAVKLAYYRRFRPSGVGAHSLASAVGMSTARVKLLDLGHTHGTFLTREFVYQLGREHARRLRALFFALSFVVPIVAVALRPGDNWSLAIAAFSCLAGLLVERWLFFAEAQHVVRLFHGQQAV